MPAAMLHDLFVRGVSCLPEMSAAALCWWTERLGTAAAKTPAWIEHSRELLALDSKSMGDSIAWLAAAEMVRHWPDHLYDFLGAFQQVPKHLQTSTGVALRFGLLLREAALLEELGYPTPAEALRHYLLERYSGGHLSRKICLFKRNQDRMLLGNRPWMTQTEAANLLQVRKAAVSQLVEQNILVGQIHAA